MGSVSMTDGKVVAQPLKPEDKGLSVNNRPGSKNEALGNVNNLRSTLVHENAHQPKLQNQQRLQVSRIHQLERNQCDKHSDNSKSFNSTTPAFKKLVYDYLQKYK